MINSKLLDKKIVLKLKKAGWHENRKYDNTNKIKVVANSFEIFLSTL